MRLPSAWIAAVGVLVPLAAAGVEVAGVTLPDTITHAEKTLNLNGAGLRTRVFLKVYVIGLYLERKSTDADEVLGPGQVRRAELHILRSLSGQQIAQAVREGFERGSSERMPALADRLSRLEALFPSVGPGDVIALTCIPGRGTEVAVNGRALGTIEGDDFATALLAVWLGREPVDASLKAALLGGAAP